MADENFPKGGCRRPSANTRDLPRREASQLSRGQLASVRRKWTPFKAVRILALLPLRSLTDAARYVTAIAVELEWKPPETPIAK